MIINMKSINILLALLLSASSSFSAVSEERSEYWRQRVSLFEKLPVYSQDIVFVGNSITDGGEFSELFQDYHVKNRGINSDVIDGVYERIDNVLSGKPAKIFLLIGINDISHNLPVSTLVEKYDRLIKKIVNESPSTKLYIQSVMPINNDFSRYKNLIGKEKVLTTFNVQLNELAVKNNVVFINLWETLADPNTGKLKPEYTNDGLHLTGNGYLQWVAQINDFVKN